MAEVDSNGNAPVVAEDAEREPLLDPELQARRRRALSMIRTFGDPALKAKALEVTTFDDVLAEEIRKMSSLMEDALGIGLAATQVGIIHRALIYRTSAGGPLVAVVNPKLEWQSEQTDVAEEGCLSLPGVVVDVERPLYVRVAAMSGGGEDLLIEASGLEARVLQHEIDHLDGVLIIDRVDREQRREALRVLRGGSPSERSLASEVSPS